MNCPSGPSLLLTGMQGAPGLQMAHELVGWQSGALVGGQLSLHTQELCNWESKLAGNAAEAQRL